LSAAQPYFCKDSNILAKKNHFSVLLNKVIKRSPEKYSILRRKVEKFIELTTQEI
jgi:hypothetical protein